MFYLLCAYLRIALFLGFHRHVYRLTCKWDDARDQPRRNRAAWAVQPALLARGYHKCPSCRWATERPNEHLEDPNSWCYEQALLRCAVCHSSLYPEDTECRYCKVDRDIEEGLRLAQEEEDDARLSRQMDWLIDEQNSRYRPCQN